MPSPIETDSQVAGQKAPGVLIDCVLVAEFPGFARAIEVSLDPLDQQIMVLRDVTLDEDDNERIEHILSLSTETVPFLIGALFKVLGTTTTTRGRPLSHETIADLFHRREAREPKPVFARMKRPPRATDEGDLEPPVCLGTDEGA